MTTNANDSQASVLDSAPKAPKTPKTPKVKSDKTSTGLIVTFFIIVACILAVGTILTIVLISRANSGSKKSDDSSVSNNDDNNNKKNDDDDNKKKDDNDNKKKGDDDNKTSNDAALTSLSAGFDGKSFKLSKNFADTIKNASEVFDIFYLDESYDYHKISNIESYLKENDTGNGSFTTLYAAKKGTDEEDVDDNKIEIAGIADYSSSSRKKVTLNKLLLWTVQTSTDQDTTATMGALTFSKGKTTPEEVRKVLGERNEGSSDKDGKWDIFTKNGYSYTVYYMSAGKVNRAEITVSVD